MKFTVHATLLTFYCRFLLTLSVVYEPAFFLSVLSLLLLLLFFLLKTVKQQGW